MAYVGDKQTCLVCGTEYRELDFSGGCVTGSGSGCPSCATYEAEKNKRAHFEKLDLLSVDERIRRIEERLYNQDNALRPKIRTF